MGDAVYALFDSVTPATEPLHRPMAGTNYLYTWNDKTTKNDWRADGYRWRQNGNSTLKITARFMKKVIFHVRRPTITFFCAFDSHNDLQQEAQLMLTYPRDGSVCVSVILVITPKRFLNYTKRFLSDTCNYLYN